MVLSLWLMLANSIKRCLSRVIFRKEVHPYPTRRQHARWREDRPGRDSLFFSQSRRVIAGSSARSGIVNRPNTCEQEEVGNGTLDGQAGRAADGTALAQGG